MRTFLSPSASAAGRSLRSPQNYYDLDYVDDGDGDNVDDSDDGDDGKGNDDHVYNLYIIGRFCLSVCNEK